MKPILASYPRISLRYPPVSIRFYSKIMSSIHFTSRNILRENINLFVSYHNAHWIDARFPELNNWGIDDGMSI